MSETPNKIAGYQNLVNNFDGDLFSNVTFFINNIESIGTLAQWDDAELIVVFKSKLRGPALQFFIDDPELNQEKVFKNVKEKFLKYFDQKTTLSQRQQLFSNCRQAPGESVRSFATKVANLTAKYFGAGNISKPDVVPIVDQTKLAKFLEGLQPSLKNLAINRNPKSFDEAVEQAQLDEINSQFSASEIVPINTFNSTQQSNIEDKLNKIVENQTKMTERLVHSLSEQMQNLRVQYTPRAPRNFTFAPRHTQPSSLHCVLCNRNNHLSHQCYSRNRNSHFNQPRIRNPQQNARSTDYVGNTPYQSRSFTPRQPQTTQYNRNKPLNSNRGR